MKNMEQPINLNLTVQGGSGDFNVVVYDRVTDKYHTFENVTSGEYQAPMYFGEKVVLEQGEA